MKITVAVLLLVGLQAACLKAQLDQLTLREAESIVERVPRVAEAQKKGECPQSSAAYPGGHEVAFQVRGSCGPASGMLIDTYTVNRRTGVVTVGEDPPQPVANQAGEIYAAQLISQTQGRILKLSEARCLALAAARNLPGWSGADGRISVEPFYKPAARETTFTAERLSSARPAQSGRMLTVNLADARVRDDETGLYVASGELGALTAKLLELRAPVSLTDEDAISIALLIPSIATQLGNGCTVAAGGAFRSQQALVGLVCKAPNKETLTVAINVRTGEPTDPDTGMRLESADAARLASLLLDKLALSRAELRREVDVLCPE